MPLLAIVWGLKRTEFTVSDDAVGVPAGPRGMRAAGRRVWRAVVGEYQLEQHEVALLRELVRCVDLLDELAEVVRRDGLMVEGPGGLPRLHPAAVEARQARIALARLSASLRLPAGDEGAGDAKGGMRRPQRRGAARGVYLRGVS